MISMPFEAQHVESRGVVVKSDFTAPWWAKNKHVQTIFPRFLQKRAPLNYRREDFCLPDGDFVNLVWAGNIHEAKALVVMFHGLEGSITSHYCHDTMASLVQDGYAVVLMHFRGCGGRPNRLPRAYHSGETGDAMYLLTYLQATCPSLPKFAIGFSLGANMLLKLLAEQGQACGLKAAIAVSAPMQLAECAKSIGQGFSRVYQAYLMRSMCHNLLTKMQTMDYSAQLTIGPEDVQQLENFRDFDQHVTAPLHGFVDADDYYQRCSALGFLHLIRVPTLILHAKDDPFMNENVLPRADQLAACVRLELSDMGGHCGFLQGTPWRPKIWFQQRSRTFFTENLNLSQ
jgi:uncharacterized protein